MQRTSNQVPLGGESDAMMQKLWRGTETDEEAGQRVTQWLCSSKKTNQRQVRELFLLDVLEFVESAYRHVYAAGESGCLLFVCLFSLN
jgi:hypothetical protein